ncbi:Na+/H+ antiporter NhaA [Acetobacteraceae bacterium]|nr:Na+/H+ antiporter NhaA [Acetobacteraceae bacterium]
MGKAGILTCIQSQFWHNFLKNFLFSAQIRGLVLVFSAVLGIFVASSPLKESYHLFLETDFCAFFPLSGLDWVNEGFLGFFFAILGIELRADCEIGPLRNFKSALFPLFGAIGGMVLPAFIAVIASLTAPQSAGLGGWAIPTATDAALTVPLLAMAKALPTGIRSFVSALAIFDDLGAIFVLALFYGHPPNLTWLVDALFPLVLLFFLGKSNLKSSLILLFSLPLTLLLWIFLCHAGVAPELAGLAWGLCLPLKSGERLFALLDLPIAWLILPLFAFCNTGIDLTKCSLDYLQSGSFLGPFLGLLLGKPLGIAAVVVCCEKLGLPAPWHSNERHWLIGAFLSCGIGFTISLLLSRLAYPEIEWQMQAEAGVALASTLSAVFAYLFLKSSDAKTQ